MNNTYDAYKSLIDKTLEGFFPSAEDGADGLRQAMQYSLLTGGKRIRPVLCLEFARLCGGTVTDCVPVACAVEMLHTYSLIHDDLPCMDNDDERRGRPTNHKVFGETTAVLAGDCLQAEAFRSVCEAGISENAKAKCCALLARAAGVSGICGGQYMDLHGADKAVDTLSMADLGKTASLMGAACAMGAAAGGADEETTAAAEAFGMALGMAFQCRDDALDKDGFYALLGEEKCAALTSMYTEKALELLGAFPDTGFLRSLTLELSGRDK